MPEPSFQMPHLPSGAGWLAALTFLGTVIGSLITWFGVRFTARAPLQEAVNHSVEILMRGWEAEDRRRAVRISELQQEVDILGDRLGDSQRDRLELSGEIANLRQAQESTLRLQEKQGSSPIPPGSKLRKPEGGEDA